MFICPICKTKTKYVLIMDWHGEVIRHYSINKRHLENMAEWAMGLEGYCRLYEWPKGQKTQMIKSLARRRNLCSTQKQVTRV